MKILMMGPDDSVQGGMTAVQQSYHQHWRYDDFPLRYIGLYTRGSKAKKLWVAIRAYIQFCVVLWCWQPRIVHVHFSWRAGFYRESIFILTAAFFARFFKCTVIAHAHAPDFEGFYQAQAVLLQRYSRFVFRQMHHLIVLSAYWQKTYQRLAPQTPVMTLYNPVNIPPEPPVTAPAALQILTMGELGQRKGTYDLLHVIPQILEKYPDVTFCLAGDGDTAKIKKLLAHETSSSNIHIPGWVVGEAKAALFRQATIFVLPSYHEGLSVAVLEAMSYGLPVITTRIGSHADMLDHEKTALLIDPGDTEALRDALLRLLAAPALRQKLGNAARQRATETFATDVILAQLYAHYRHLTH